MRSAVAVVLAAAALPAWAGSIAPGLDEALSVAGPRELVPVVVMMETYPARGELLGEVRGLNREDRRNYVVRSLKERAAESQQPVHSLLAGVPEEIRNVRVLWGINGVALEATPRVIEELSALPQVLWLKHDGGRGRPAVVDFEQACSADGSPGDGTCSEDAVRLTGPTGGDVSGPNPDATVAPEVVAMGAKQVWDDLGYTGAGVIVAVIDTGVDPTQPDLADHLWTNIDELPGNGIDDDGNGYVDDTWGWDFCESDNVPDSGAHGTQAAGQVAGDGTGGTVTGMAPDAEIMVLGINCTPPDSIGWEASDYAIANGAHIITESFIWPWTEDTPDFEGWRRQTDAQLAAGIIHASAAGNDGQNPIPAIPYNVSAPANSPAPWIHPDQTLAGGVSSTIAVGNIAWSSDTIAASSSRGPAAWEDIVANTDPGYPFPMAPEYMDYPYENGAQMGLIKPDISAYGNGTTTTCPGPSYCQFSGTSSATPHVAGVLALMLQSNPEATPAELTEAILTVAEHRGDPGKNNVYGTGLLQAHAAVAAVESGVLYASHSFDDGAGGNGDLALDPGEQLVMAITVRSVTSDAAVTGLEAILSSTTPGVTIHNHHATYPTVAALGTVVSNAPHYSLSIDPSACTEVITFDLELRFEGKVRRSTFKVRVGDETPLVLLDDDFETDQGWSSDPGTTTRGAWVREDPEGTIDDLDRLANPEDDTSDPGVTCWVTGNGELNGPKGINNNDVDDGTTTLTSPPFGELHMLSLELTYDAWYYDTSGPAADALRTEFSTDGGQSWTLVEETTFGFGGWETRTSDLFALLPPTDDMRLRFTASDGVDDSPVEGAVDEVRVTGVWVDCQDHASPAALAPNPVGDTLHIDVGVGGHAELTWDAPPVDAGHGAATLYRIERATSPAGPFEEAGSATETRWMDIDAIGAVETHYYQVHAENAGGPEAP